MGLGIDLAKQQEPELAQALDDMKDQLIIVLINRLGGNIEVPVSEIDNTSGWILKMALDRSEYGGEIFKFKTSEKH